MYSRVERIEVTSGCAAVAISNRILVNMNTVRSDVTTEPADVSVNVYTCGRLHRKNMVKHKQAR